MGWNRKIIPLWILFAGSLIASCAASMVLEPGDSVTYNATIYGYIRSACYDSSRNVTFIGTTALGNGSSHVIPFSIPATYGTPIPIDGTRSLDICIFDPTQNYIYFVPKVTSSDSELYITRVNVTSTTPNSTDVSYAVLEPSAAKIAQVNFGILVDENVIALVSSAVVKIPLDQLNFTAAPTPVDSTTVMSNTEAVTIFERNDTSFIAGFTDGNIGYFVTTEEPARMFSIDLAANGAQGTDEKNNLTILGSGNLTIGPIQNCVYDNVRKLANCWNSVPGVPSQVVKVRYLQSATDDQVNVTSLTQTAIVALGINSKEMSVAVLDTVHGQMYLGGGNTQNANGYVAQVNLKSFTQKPPTDIPLKEGQKYLQFGWMVDDETLYFGYGWNDVIYTNIGRAGIFAATLPDVCPGTPECSGRGQCVYATCVCDPLSPTDQLMYPNSTYYAGIACESVNCYQDCINNMTGFQGICEDGECRCGTSYTGPYCETQQCPSNCSGRGVCNQANYTCKCDEGWQGNDCATQVQYACAHYKNCKDCLGDTSCGWCRSEGKCTEGDLNGPFESGEEGCTSWYFTQCPEIGMEFFGYVFTILAGIMLLINIVSLIQEESNPLLQNKSSDLDIRETWWRNQRSVKTWLMIDEIQFAAITAMFAVKSPSLYFNFVSIFRWSVIGFPLPWSQRDFNSGRDTLSMDQYSSSILVFDIVVTLLTFQAKDTEVFFGSLFWLVMLVIFSAVVFFVLRLFGRMCFTSDYGLRNFFRNRLVYTLVRIAMFAYFPFAVFTTYSFTVNSGAAIAISIVFLLAVHGILAVFLWRIQPKTKKDSTKLFRPEFLTRYGCLYHSFYVKRAWFQEVVFLRKLVMGAIVGLLQNFETVQLILLLIAQTGYLIAVVMLQPVFLDSFHMFIEISSCIGHLIMIAMMFPFVGSLKLDLSDDVAIFLSVAIAAISLILQLICIGGFINNWMKMNNIASFMELVERCRGGKGSGKGIDVELDLTRDKLK